MNKTPVKLVILDRDGVINHDSDDFVKSAAEWLPIDGSIEAIAKLSRCGFKVAVATNQSGIGRGLYERSALYAMNRKLRKLVAEQGGKVDLIVSCPHAPDEGCECRKPKPGLLLQVQKKLGLSLNGVAFIGDSYRDLQAAVAAGCDPWLVATGNGLQAKKEITQRKPDWVSRIVVCENLAAAAKKLCG